MIINLFIFVKIDKFGDWNYIVIKTWSKDSCRTGFYTCEKCCDVNGDCRCDQICSDKRKVDGICSYINEGKDKMF